jgi:hypothetical protein
LSFSLTLSWIGGRGSSDNNTKKKEATMITIGISKWPTESGKEMGTRSLEMNPLPNFIQMIGPYMYPDEDEGITAITIFKYDKTRAGEASEAIASSFLTFFGVPGFRYSLKLASGTAATMEMMGFK